MTAEMHGGGGRLAVLSRRKGQLLRRLRLLHLARAADNGDGCPTKMRSTSCPEFLMVFLVIDWFLLFSGRFS